MGYNKIVLGYTKSYIKETTVNGEVTASIFPSTDTGYSNTIEWNRNVGSSEAGECEVALSSSQDHLSPIELVTAVYTVTQSVSSDVGLTIWQRAVKLMNNTLALCDLYVLEAGSMKLLLTADQINSFSANIFESSNGDWIKSYFVYDDDKSKWYLNNSGGTYYGLLVKEVHSVNIPTLPQITKMDGSTYRTVDTDAGSVEFDWNKLSSANSSPLGVSTSITNDTVDYYLVSTSFNTNTATDPKIPVYFSSGGAEYCTNTKMISTFYEGEIIQKTGDATTQYRQVSGLTVFAFIGRMILSLATDSTKPYRRLKLMYFPKDGTNGTVTTETVIGVFSVSSPPPEPPPTAGFGLSTYSITMQPA